MKEQNLSPSTRFIYNSYLKYLQTGLLIEAQSIPSFKGDSFDVIYSAGKVGNSSQLAPITDASTSSTL